MKVVLDTNVLVSALIVPRGKPARILDAAADLKFQLVISPHILDELREVLQRRHIQKRFHPSAEDIETYVAERLPRLALVITPQHVENAIPNDPPDNLVLACALEGGADFLVSGNDHLLALRDYRGIQIVTPAGFLHILDSMQEGGA
jgi:uncharacterized protein